MKPFIHRLHAMSVLPWGGCTQRCSKNKKAATTTGRNCLTFGPSGVFASRPRVLFYRIRDSIQSRALICGVPWSQRGLRLETPRPFLSNKRFNSIPSPHLGPSGVFASRPRVLFYRIRNSIQSRALICGVSQRNATKTPQGQRTRQKQTKTRSEKKSGPCWDRTSDHLIMSQVL